MRWLSQNARSCLNCIYPMILSLEPEYTSILVKQYLLRWLTSLIVSSDYNSNMKILHLGIIRLLDGLWPNSLNFSSSSTSSCLTGLPNKSNSRWTLSLVMKGCVLLCCTISVMNIFLSLPLSGINLLINLVKVITQPHLTKILSGEQRPNTALGRISPKRKTKPKDRASARKVEKYERRSKGRVTAAAQQTRQSSASNM